MSYTIYLIKDPRDQAPLYVGNTDDFEGRKAAHMNDAQTREPDLDIMHLRDYLAGLHKMGQAPEFETLQEVESRDEIEDIEKNLVKDYTEKDQPLLNNWSEFQTIMNDKFSPEQITEYFQQRLRA